MGVVGLGGVEGPQVGSGGGGGQGGDGGLGGDGGQVERVLRALDPEGGGLGLGFLGPIRQTSCQKLWLLHLAWLSNPKLCTCTEIIHFWIINNLEVFRAIHGKAIIL